MDFERLALGRLDPVATAIWLGVIIAASLGLCLRHDDAGRLTFRPSFAIIGLVGPWTALVLCIAAFGAGRGHPLAQYDGDLGGWSLWVRAWFPLQIASLALFALTLVAGVAAASRRSPSRWQNAIRWFTASWANVWTLLCVVANFPSC